MFYPTGKSTNGRVLIDIQDYEGEIVPMLEGDREFLLELDKWLEENNYCVEKHSLKELMQESGFFSKEEIDEMEGAGGDIGGVGGSSSSGGEFATLGNVPGMGNPIMPGPDGSIGSGDRFELNLVRPKKKKNKNKLSIISDIDSFIASMRKKSKS